MLEVEISVSVLLEKTEKRKKQEGVQCQKIFLNEIVVNMSFFEQKNPTKKPQNTTPKKTPTTKQTKNQRQDI